MVLSSNEARMLTGLGFEFTPAALSAEAKVREKIFCSSDSFILLLSSTPPDPVTSVALKLILSVIITIGDHRGIRGRNRHLS